MRKTNFLILTILGLSLVSLIGNAQAMTYKVNVGDTWIWKYYDPATPDNFYYLKVAVNGNVNGTLALSGTMYDPVSNNATVFDSIAPNFVYSTEQLNIINTNSSYAASNVSRTYADRTVSALRFQIDADNVAYLDWDTGLLLEAVLNLGSTKVNFIIVSWTNQDFSIYQKTPTTTPGPNFQVPGFPLLGLVCASTIGTILLIRKKKE